MTTVMKSPYLALAGIVLRAKSNPVIFVQIALLLRHRTTNIIHSNTYLSAIEYHLTITLNRILRAMKTMSMLTLTLMQKSMPMIQTKRCLDSMAHLAILALKIPWVFLIKQYFLNKKITT